jgi:hypothetical protein
LDEKRKCCFTTNWGLPAEPTTASASARLGRVLECRLSSDAQTHAVAASVTGDTRKQGAVQKAPLRGHDAVAAHEHTAALVHEHDTASSVVTAGEQDPTIGTTRRMTTGAS